MNNFTLIDYIELISVERPLFLALALLPLLLIFLKRIKMHSLSNYAEKSLWPWSINISEQHFKSRKMIQFIAWLLIAIAMSGPRLPGYNKTFSKHDKNIKSDVSIMLIADINGITKTEFNSYIIKISDFIDKLNGEKVGFVALTSTSALISPLTNDYTVSYFYLKQMFNIINKKPRFQKNDLYRSLQLSYKEIQESNSTSGIIIYWSDYIRSKIKSQELIKTKILLEEIQGQNIEVIPIWNDSNEPGMDSSDIIAIYGDSSDDYSNLSIQDLYEEYLENIKSLTLFNSNKKHDYQQLFSYPLISGLLLLLFSFIPFQTIKKVRK